MSDFGDDSYIEGLGVLLGAYDENRYFSDFGRQAALDQVVGVLSSRLESERGWQADDRWQTTSIERPVFIVGLARTGTTALHKLIAMDPAIQSMPFWLGVHPQPRPPRASWSSSRAFQDVKATLEGRYERTPNIRALHDMQADEPDECRLLRMQSFNDFLVTTLYVPSYHEWLVSADQRSSYCRYRNNLRLIASGDDRRWVLKCPGHLWALDALLAEFPDACVIHTHRDPVEAIVSTCSVIYTASSRFMEPDLPLDVFGREILQRWHSALQRAGQVRSQSDPRQFYDLDYRRFVADPLAEVERIYDYFDIGLSGEARRAMRTWHEDRPPGQHGDHRYNASQFGLDEHSIRDLFSDYRARHGLA